MLPDLSRHNLIGLDTEGTGVDFHSKPVGISVATPDGEGWYVRWGHERGGNNCTRQQAKEWLANEVNRPGKQIVCHNLGHDLRQLAYVNMPLDRTEAHCSMTLAALLNENEDDYKLDTLSQKYLSESKEDDKIYKAAAALFGGRPDRKSQAENIWRLKGGGVAPYAIQDAKLCLRLYTERINEIDVQSLQSVYALEQRLPPILLKMHMLGTRVNVGQAEQTSEDLRVQGLEAGARWRELAGFDAGVRSRTDLKRVFEQLGLKYPITKKGNPSFAKEFLERLDHEAGELIMGLRKVDHYRGTFIQNYVINLAVNGVLHCSFHPTRNDWGFGTVSGRFSSSWPNLQNVPMRDSLWAPLIRGLFIPMHDGMIWVKADYSQIEYRYFAHYAGGNLRQAYNDNPHVDFHQMAAELTSTPRKQAKNINFATVYGAGIGLLAVMMGASEDEAREVYEIYHARIPEVKRLNDRCQSRASARGYITAADGRRHRFNGKRKVFTALNRLLQGSAAGLMKKAMVAVDEVIDWETMLMHLTVHDELDFSLEPNESGFKMLRQVREAMQGCEELTVPIICDVETGADWGHLTNWEN